MMFEEISSDFYVTSNGSGHQFDSILSKLNDEQLKAFKTFVGQLRQENIIREDLEVRIIVISLLDDEIFGRSTHYFKDSREAHIRRCKPCKVHSIGVL